MIVEIPLQVDNQYFEQTTEINGVTLLLVVKFNTISEIWTVDIKNEDTNTWLILGLPLVLGCDILAPYKFGLGALILVDNSNQHIDAGIDELGDRVVLISVT